MDKILLESLKYLTVNERDETWGLSVSTIGFQVVNPFDTFPPAGHPQGYYYDPKQGRILPEYGLIYFIKGEGHFSSKYEKNIKIEAGSLIVIFPGEWHNYVPVPEVGWQCYWIHFKGNFADHITKQIFFEREKPLLYIGLNENLIDLYNQAIHFAEQEQVSFQQVLSGITMNMLGLIYYLEKNNNFADKEIRNKINKAKFLMRERFATPISLEEIAQDINVSYSWFRRMFKVYSGLSPAQYIMQLKLSKAKTILTSSRMSIKEIAYELTFENPNHFYSFFKKRTGMTPEQYRNHSISHHQEK
jgi:AraC-like DNA-binding protein